MKLAQWQIGLLMLAGAGAVGYFIAKRTCKCGEG